MNNGIPSVSIVLPCCQSEAYLPHIVQAIRRQAFADWELIVVGNGPKQDAQRKIIEEFARQDARISYVSIEPAGVSRARNVGLDIARGEWIAFVDADDDVPEDWLVRYANHFESTPDIIAGGLIYRTRVSEKKQDLKLPQDCNTSQWKNPSKFLPIYLSDMAVMYSPCTKIFNARFLKKSGVRFDESLTIYEDGVFCLACALRCSSMRFIQQTGYVYCAHEGSAIGRYHTNLEKSLFNRRTLLKEARMWAGYSEDVVRREDDLQFAADSLDIFLNVYRAGSSCRFRNKVHLVKKLFADERLGDVFKRQTLPKNNLPLIAYYFSYRIRSATFCASLFSFLFVIRRMMRRL